MAWGVIYLCTTMHMCMSICPPSEVRVHVYMQATAVHLCLCRVEQLRSAVRSLTNIARVFRERRAQEGGCGL